MSDPVFVSPGAAAVTPGDSLTLAGDEARHAATVMRVAPGERITAVDGRGSFAAGVVESATPEAVRIRIDEAGRQYDRPVVLVQALAKGGRDEQAVESATELGVTRVVPWAASRSIAKWKGPKIDKGRAKWAALALKAAKQSRRAIVPEVDEVADTGRLARLVAGATAEGARVIVLHEAATTPLATIPWYLDARHEVWFVVGPEGGIADLELETLEQAGATVALLGPHVLRASTAGPTAIAVAKALSGDWSSPTLEP